MLSCCAKLNSAAAAAAHTRSNGPSGAIRACVRNNCAWAARPCAACLLVCRQTVQAASKLVQHENGCCGWKMCSLRALCSPPPPCELAAPDDPCVGSVHPEPGVSAGESCV